MLLFVEIATTGLWFFNEIYGMNDIYNTLFDLELRFWAHIVGLELESTHRNEISPVIICYLDLAEPGTDKTVETTWKQEADGTMSVLESKIV